MIPFSIPVATGVVLRADRSFLSKEQRPNHAAHPAVRVPAPLPPSSWPRPGPCTAFPSSTASRLQPCTAACPRSCPRCSQGPGPAPSGEPQVPTHRGARKARPEPETCGRRPWAATPHPEYWPSAPARLFASTSCSLSQSRPQPQKAHLHGASFPVPPLGVVLPAVSQQAEGGDPKMLDLG